MIRIKRDLVLRSVAGSIIVVPVGKASLDFNGMLTLNPAGEFLWRLLENGAETDELEKALSDKYGIDGDTARTDVRDFIDSLKGADLLE